MALSLDCCHIRWKNCQVAWPGQFEGKEGEPTIVLEATCQPMVCHQHFNLIPFRLHCRMPLDRGQSRMSDMNYDADHFSSVWTKVVLPTIKNEIELAEERICGSNQESNHSWYGYMYCWMRICLQLINKPIACLSHNKYV